MTNNDCRNCKQPKVKFPDLKQLLGKYHSEHHFEGELCVKALIHKFMPDEAQNCLMECVAKDLPKPPSKAELRQKLEWLEDPDDEPPDSLLKVDLKRAALCVINQ